jgi:hypothetical protein
MGFGRMGDEVMKNDIEPIEGNWYVHLDKGQRFEVVTVDSERGLVEIQHFDGDLEEVSLEEWDEMPVELSEEPENWSGPIDVDEIDDLGTEITDTSKEDWSEPLSEFRQPERVQPTQDFDEMPDDWGEGVPDERPLGEADEQLL